MQKLMIFMDSRTKSLLDAAGNYVTQPSKYPTLERGQWQVLCVQFLDRLEDEFGDVTITKHSLDGDHSYVFVADSNFNDEDSLMVKSMQSTIPFDEANTLSNRINITGDWIDGTTADMSKGQLSIRVNTDTAKFTEVMGTDPEITDGLFACIKQYIDGFSNPSSIAWFPFVAKNTIRDWSIPEELPPEGIQVAPYVAAALKNPVEFQFSVNGVSDWHETQTGNDAYYRQRIANLDAEWSEAVAFVLSEGGGVGSTNAANIIVSSESEFYAGMDVASVLQLIGADLDGLEDSLSSIATDMEAI